MGDKTGISWCDSTWNPVRGCSRVSEGCRHCYAERVAARFCGPGQPYEGLATLRRAKRITGPTGELTTPVASRSAWTGVVRLVPEHLADPLRWRKPRRIFVNSMSDLFHESLSNEQIAAVFGVMAAAPQHTFQVLTKRAKRMREWFAIDGVGPVGYVEHHARHHLRDRGIALPPGKMLAWPLPHVWLGVSVENQEAADERIPELLATPAAVRFLSCEPLLGPVEIRGGRDRCGDCDPCSAGQRCSVAGFHVNALHPDGVSWVIAGCESGPGARTCDVSWLRSLRDQCASAGVAFFLKQARPRDGEYTITDTRPVPAVFGRIGDAIPVLSLGVGAKEKAGGVIELPYLDGVQHAAFPASPAAVS